MALLLFEFELHSRSLVIVYLKSKTPENTAPIHISLFFTLHFPGGPGLNSVSLCFRIIYSLCLKLMSFYLVLSRLEGGFSGLWGGIFIFLKINKVLLDLVKINGPFHCFSSLLETPISC